MVHGIEQFCSDEIDEALTPTLTSNDGHFSWPVFVKEVRFVLKNVRQSTPYPAESNEIIVDIRTNVKLLAICQPSITLTGLLGSLTVTPPVAGPPMSVNDYTDSGLLESTGDWNQDGTMVVTLAYDYVPEPAGEESKWPLGYQGAASSCQWVENDVNTQNEVQVADAEPDGKVFEKLLKIISSVK